MQLLLRPALDYVLAAGPAAPPKPRQQTFFDEPENFGEVAMNAPATETPAPTDTMWDKWTQFAKKHPRGGYAAWNEFTANLSPEDKRQLAVQVQKRQSGTTRDKMMEGLQVPQGDQGSPTDDTTSTLVAPQPVTPQSGSTQQWWDAMEQYESQLPTSPESVPETMPETTETMEATPEKPKYTMSRDQMRYLFEHPEEAQQTLSMLRQANPEYAAHVERNLGALNKMRDVVAPQQPQVTPEAGSAAATTGINIPAWAKGTPVEQQMQQSYDQRQKAQQFEEWAAGDEAKNFSPQEIAQWRAQFQPQQQVPQQQQYYYPQQQQYYPPQGGYPQQQQQQRQPQSFWGQVGQGAAKGALPGAAGGAVMGGPLGGLLGGAAGAAAGGIAGGAKNLWDKWKNFKDQWGQFRNWQQQQQQPTAAMASSETFMKEAQLSFDDSDEDLLLYEFMGTLSDDEATTFVGLLEQQSDERLASVARGYLKMA